MLAAQLVGNPEVDVQGDTQCIADYRPHKQESNDSDDDYHHDHIATSDPMINRVGFFVNLKLTPKIWAEQNRMIFSNDFPVI